MSGTMTEKSTEERYVARYSSTRVLIVLLETKDVIPCRPGWTVAAAEPPFAGWAYLREHSSLAEAFRDFQDKIPTKGR